MSQNIQKGKAGEEIAIAMLRSKGYTVERVNWRTAHLEIDIIAKTGNTTVFVEVKARVGDDAGMPERGITNKKIKNLQQAADAYMQDHETDKIRFDVVAIMFIAGEKPDVYHIEDAFF
jgi:putative endonuclease